MKEWAKMISTFAFLCIGKGAHYYLFWEHENVFHDLYQLKYVFISLSLADQILFLLCAFSNPGIQLYDCALFTIRKQPSLKNEIILELGGVLNLSTL